MASLVLALRSLVQRGPARRTYRRYWRTDMQIRRITAIHAPVLLLDPQTESAAALAAYLEANGFPTRIERTGAGAQSAIKEAYFATLIVIADLDDQACLEWLEALRRIASRSWMIVAIRRRAISFI